MLKTTFDFDDSTERGYTSTNNEHDAMYQKEDTDRHLRMLQIRAGVVSALEKENELKFDDLSEILYKLLTKPARGYLEASNCVNHLRNKDRIQIAEDISFIIIRLFDKSGLDWGRRSGSDSLMLPMKILRDGIEFLERDIQGYLNKCTTRCEENLCQEILWNLHEKTKLARGRMSTRCSNAKYRSMISSNTAYGLEDLNKLLASATVGNPFLLDQGLRLIPLRRKAKKRSFIFLNELSAKYLNLLYSGRSATNRLNTPVAILPGTVILNKDQNLMVDCSLFWKPNERIQEMIDNFRCVDVNEQSSNGRTRVAPYLGEPHCKYHNLHRAHLNQTHSKHGQIDRLTKKLSEKNCCGYMLAKKRNIVGLELFDNPNDFKAVSKHFAEYLYGTFRITSPNKQDFMISNQKNLRILPASKTIDETGKWGFLKNHNLGIVLGNGIVAKSMHKLTLEGEDKPTYMSLKW